MIIKVLMRPHINDNLSPSGISTVVEKYFKYLPNYGIELVNEDADSIDLMACHASAPGYKNLPLVSHCHGLYWTGDNPNAEEWEWAENAFVVQNLVQANQITVPSEWVAQTIRRDMHINPHVIPHGIDFEEWDHNEPYEQYILWNKNRETDACSTEWIDRLSRVFPSERFVSTFGNANSNLHIIGTQNKKAMQEIVRKTGVYLSTSKETFGIGVLEAMASGVPILGFNNGGNKDIVQHGVTGYLAQPNNLDDLCQGLEFCINNRSALGDNARESAKAFSWPSAIEKVAGVYKIAKHPIEPSVSVIIPCYNKALTVGRAIESVLNQTVQCEVIVVDNNSTDDSRVKAERYLTRRFVLDTPYPPVSVLSCPDQGVSHARNYGIQHAKGNYIVCLDADDEIEPEWIENCLKGLHNDPQCGIAYTRIRHIDQSGHETISEWPREFSYDGYYQSNQIPTTCMFRKLDWQRVGGYRQRYAPIGAGSEDSDFFLRITSAGCNAKLINSNESFFRYYSGGGTSVREYREVDWREDKGWFTTKQYPLACRATPENGYSHPVCSYDEPEISVIIPVGKGHEKFLIDALDSIEGQTFKKWEVIVVWDQGIDDLSVNNEYIRVKSSFPYANHYFMAYDENINNDPPRGAGFCRNVGARNSKSNYLFFLDADDWLEPTALEKLYQKRHEGIVYSSYYGHAFVDNPDEIANRVVDYHAGIAKVLHPALNYDCERAIREPSTGYLWCIISCLIPKLYHEEIGGFDEDMESWEDWDYFIRMAQAGKWFEKIDEPLLNYRFYSGQRRELGRQTHEKLIEYMKDKYKDIDMAGCCGRGRSRGRLAMPKSSMMMASADNIPDLGDTVRVQLNDGNIGDHPIIGHVTKNRYGHRKHGDIFQIDERDFRAAKPGSLIEVKEQASKPIESPPPPVSVIAESPTEFDWKSVKGIGDSKAAQLTNAGIMNPTDLLNMDNEKLREIFSESALARLMTELEKTVISSHT